MKRHYPLQIALVCLFVSSIAGGAVLPENIFREPVRVSVGASGNAGDNDSNSFGGRTNHFSADGRYLVFSSRAANISNDDTDSFSDIHVYDRQSLALQLISRAGVSGAKGNNDSLAPSMSLDGRFIAFSSKASNLDSADADSISDIYLYDRNLGTVELISRSGAGEKGNQDSNDAALSGDGRYVAFASTASNLGDGDKDTLSDIYVYDRSTATLEWVSRAGASGVKGNDESYRPAISADGRYVAFISKGSSLGNDIEDNSPEIVVYDRYSGSVRSVGRVGTNDAEEDKNLSGPSISADGRYISYSSRASGPFADVFVYDLETGTEELVSRAGAGEPKANGDSVDPAISADGRYVTFTSFADNLGDGDTDALPDIHVYDRQLRVLHWLSRPAGESGELAGFAFPAPSADGTLLAFSAYSGNTKGAPCCLQVFVKETGLKASNLNIVSTSEANSDTKPAGAASLTPPPDFTSSLFTAESVSASAVAGYEPSKDISRSNVSLNGSPRPRTYWGAVSDDTDNTWVDTSFRATQANVTFGYPDVGALNNGQVTVRYRFRAGTSSNSNVAVTVTLLNGSTTLGTSLARTLTEGSAAFEYSETFTGVTISSGANLRTKFSWTRTASNQPAQLKEVDIDVDTGGACTPETDAEFCARLAKSCGQVTGTDNCGSSRTVSSCGECTSPETCSTSNICTIPNPTAPGSFQIPVTTGSPAHTTNVGLVIFGHSTSDQGNFPDKLAAALNDNTADNRHYVVLRAIFPGDGGFFWTKLKFAQNDVNYQRVLAGTQNKQWCTPAGSTDRWSCRRLNFEKAFNNGSAPAGANECATDNTSGPECSTLDTALTNVSDCSYYSGSAVKGVNAKTSLLNTSFRNCLDKMDVKIALIMDTTSPSWAVDDYNLDGDITDADVFDRDNLTNASLSPWQCPASSGLVGTDKIDWDCDGGSTNDPGDNPAKVYAGWLKSFATELISSSYNFNFVVLSQKTVERWKTTSQYPNEAPHPHNQRAATPSRPFVQYYNPAVYWEHKGLVELAADATLDPKIKVLSPVAPSSMWNKSATCYESGLSSASWSIPLSVIDDKYETLTADRKETDAAPETGCFKYIDHTHAYDAGGWMIADVWYNGLHPYLW
jgi:hypothetical protein